MISFLRGKLAGVTAETITVDVGGIGFTVTVAPSTLARLPSAGEEITVYTYLVLRESGAELYGFLCETECATFSRLLSVGSVGPRSALALVSSLGVAQLWDAIRREDAELLTRVPGIGKKTAARLILELRDAAVREAVAMPGGQELNEALDALIKLGYSREEALYALSRVPGANTGAAERVKAALRWLDRTGDARHVGGSR